MTEVSALVIAFSFAGAFAWLVTMNVQLPKRRRSNSVISKDHKKLFNLKP